LPALLYPAYEARLISELKGKPQPKHVAVMADGNRRWARVAGFEDISHGHRQGAKKISEMVSWCADTEVEVVTIYLLSTENLKRSKNEVSLLFDIITEVVDHLSHGDLNCQVHLVGHLDLLPDEVTNAWGSAAAAARANDGVIVNLAVGYGCRQEIADAVKAMMKKEVEAGSTPEELVERITVDSTSKHLHTEGLPDPDLVIRTSREQR